MLELSTLIAAFVQELVSPFPSFLIFVPAGVALAAQHAGPGRIALLLALIGLVRVVASLILYLLSTRIRGWLYARRTSWLGIRRADLDRTRDRLGANGSGWTVFWLWALPVVPGTLIALAAGFVRVPIRTFGIASYFGSIANAATYLLIGYFGLHLLGN